MLLKHAAETKWNIEIKGFISAILTNLDGYLWKKIAKSMNLKPRPLE